MFMGLDQDTGIALAAVGVVFGLIFGSAINALVWRVYVGRSWVHGRSECPDCGHVLSAKDLVPVVSWALLGGKCRYCRKPIKDHPVVELLTALVFGASAYVLAPVTAVDWTSLGFWLLMVSLLIALAAYDARWMLLPDKLMRPLGIVALLYVVTMAIMTHSPMVLGGALTAAVLAGGSFLAIAYISKGRAMGGGDIKLAFVMGLMLGVQGTAVALLVAFDAAAVIGVARIAMGKRGRKDQIPFGPYLVAGTMVAFLFGRDLVDWYLHLNGIV